MQKRKNSCRINFTLLELLIVIAVIAILVGLILPALHKAKERGRNAACQSNLKQIGNGLFLYAGDNDDFIPHIYVLNSSSTPVNTWSYLLRGYIKTIRVYLCPSDSETLLLYAGKTLFSQLDSNGWNSGGLNGRNSGQFSYGMNSKTNIAGTSRSKNPIRLTKNRHTRGIVADTEPYRPGFVYVYRLDLAPTSTANGQYSSALSIFHNMGSNYLNTDGSVSYGKKEYLRTNPQHMWDLIK